MFYFFTILNALLSHIALAEDFPSIRNFGPYVVYAGEEGIGNPLVLGPTGIIGWRHGREFVIREIDPGSPADGNLRAGDGILGANGHGLGADPRMGLGYAVTESEAKDGRLLLEIYRDGKTLKITLQLKSKTERKRTTCKNC